jgi:hypothetical protein
MVNLGFETAMEEAAASAESKTVQFQQKIRKVSQEFPAPLIEQIGRHSVQPKDTGVLRPPDEHPPERITESRRGSAGILSPALRRPSESAMSVCFA